MLNLLILVYLVLLLLRPMEFIPALEGVPLLQGLLLACMGLWLFRKEKRLDLPQAPLVIWFVIAAMISVGMAGWWGGSIERLAYLTPIVMLFLLISLVARDLVMLKRILKVTIVCACIMVVHGQLQLDTGVGWSGLPPLLGRITYSGIFSDPNDLGQLFVLCIAFLLYLYQETGKFYRLLIIASVVWLVYGIYLTDSRGTMLAGMAVLGLEGLRRFGKVAVGVLGFLAAVALIATTRFAEIDPSEQSAMDRVESWYAGTQMFIGSPLTGVGMGNYIEHHYLTAHNFIVLPMAELGLFGFIPWMGVLWFTGRMLYWLCRGPHVPVDPQVTTPAVMASEQHAANGLLGAAVGFFISSFFLSQSYKHVLFFTVALVMARFAHASKLYQDPPTLSVMADLPKIALLSILTIFFMWMVMKVLV